MQPSHRSRRILLPAKAWFVYFSLILALSITFIPTGRFPGVPDWVALILVFWCIREPRLVGMGMAFGCGLIVDLIHAAVMGQHALAYVLMAYAAGLLSRRILWFGLGGQALHVFCLLLGSQIFMVVLRMAVGADFPGWSYFLSSLVGAALWAPLTFILLLPQYQPVNRDENRPI